MFKSVTYYTLSEGRSVHRLVDSDFTVFVRVEDPAIGLVKAVFDAYKKRGAPVAPNMALFYIWYYGYQNAKRMIKRDKDLFDFYAPSLQYHKKYYPCIVRQLAQRMFGLKISVPQ